MAVRPPNDLPVSYNEGNKRIRQMALMHLQESLVNNTAANIFRYGSTGATS